MQTLNLKEAADFLKMTPEGLRKKVSRKEIPATKIGRYWLFIQEDLVVYIRSRYSSTAETSWGVVRKTTWHSTKEVKSGGSTSVTKAKEYNELLGLPVNQALKNFMTK